ncbi:macrophage mannose receptor 1-like [Acipenser oxyrinchus oxyrinchus]|uniref:Macrophage mannose receptor 1-like n=1 Tax=Acipenser oxyrinchus oxyrinchus TaxID=40147 RepID=A0AAD8CTS0_ACIOX|nr:macrophage mannose receptor 1-like [Acipenser oxyrinchus oxyrinchus]
MSWSEAQSYCREKHTDLATVRSQEEAEQLLNITGGSVNATAWIGLYRDDTQNWQWSNSDDVIFYSNWTANLFCASVRSSGEWRDLRCQEKNPFMCYNETSNITERYTLIEELKTWTEAQQYCREHHTDLVSIKNASENEDLVKKALGKTFWIGLFNNPWKWSHQGDNSTFHNWANGEPNNEKGNEKCVVMNKTGKWYDSSCSRKAFFICYVRDLVLEKENKTWEEAVDHCRAQHRELASIVSEKEQRYAAHLSKRANSPLVWIGLRQSRLFGFWFWMNSEPLDYTQWKGGVQPPAYPDSSPCVAMTTESDHHWTEKPCSEKLNFFCF